ncbi:hypothetical protein NL676_034228 [Syzygium grande]|nr:hypothetical protein NL676_034228 [Syzygium grande]
MFFIRVPEEKSRYLIRVFEEKSGYLTISLTRVPEEKSRYLIRVSEEKSGYLTISLIRVPEEKSRCLIRVSEEKSGYLTRVPEEKFRYFIQVSEKKSRYLIIFLNRKCPRRNPGVSYEYSRRNSGVVAVAFLFCHGEQLHASVLCLSLVVPPHRQPPADPFAASTFKSKELSPTRHLVALALFESIIGAATIARLVLTPTSPLSDVPAVVLWESEFQAVLAKAFNSSEFPPMIQPHATSLSIDH